LLSTQWFLKLPDLIKQIEQKDPNFIQKINFFPPKFKKTIEEWKAKTYEWCISRQLWWGHRIPAWYNKKTGEIYVGKELKKKCSLCENPSKEITICRHEDFCPLREW
jgi:valyl-tRNA synthetase